MSGTETPQSPDGTPLLGHAMAFSRDPFGALEEWASHGDVVRLAFPGETFYLVSDPALIEAVLHDGEGRFTIATQQRRTFAGVEDDAVSAATGERWRRLRGALQPSFARGSIDRYADGMVDRTLTRIEAWDDGGTIDLHREMRLLTLEVLAATLLGIEVEGDENVVLEAADALVARSDPRWPGQRLPDWVPTPTDRRFRRAVADLDSYVDRCLEVRRGGERGNDALTAMLEAADRGELTEQEVRHNLVALLLTGSDTTALALTYCLYLLSDHPDVRRSLADEYDERVGSGRPTLAEWESLERHRRVVSETLRLYPPTWNTMRRTTRPVSLGGYRLPEGAELLFPQWVLHRDERFWASPTASRPARWDDEGDGDERPQYAYSPFSGGPRHCIGKHFAGLELELALATMVGRVELAVAAEDGEPLSFVPGASLRPETRLEATVRRRWVG